MQRRLEPTTRSDQYLGNNGDLLRFDRFSASYVRAEISVLSPRREGDVDWGEVLRAYPTNLSKNGRDYTQLTPYLATDVVIFYVDEETRELSVFVGFKDVDQDPGWVVPGTYVATEKGDTCMEDAAYRVVETETGVHKKDVRSLKMVCWVDDFGRDTRRPVAGAVYFAQVDVRPEKSRSLKEVVGIPFSVFADLCNRNDVVENGVRGKGFSVPPDSELAWKHWDRRFPMTWNHDSILRAALDAPESKAFLRDVQRQCKFVGVRLQPVNEGLTDDVFSCPVCIAVLSEPCTLLCGHSLCRACLDSMIASGIYDCPLCRQSFRGHATTVRTNVVLREAVRVYRSTANSD